MSAAVTVDEKGRLVLPKKVRQEAGIAPNSKLVARAKGRGQIELFDPDLLLRRAQVIGSKKLAGWREEDHEAEALLRKLVPKRAHETA